MSESIREGAPPDIILVFPQIHLQHAGVHGFGGEVALHMPNEGMLTPVAKSRIFARFFPKKVFRGATTDNLLLTVPNEHSRVAPSTTNSFGIANDHPLLMTFNFTALIVLMG